jgi:spermidine synthase
MALCFAITLFVSATLLFLVQPMLAKMILPLLGGVPSVWNTCMVFFQAALLAGYAYAHFVRTHFSIRRQVLVHGLVLLAPLAVLPIRVADWTPPSTEDNPIGWLLLMLLRSAGLPFFAVATTAPLLQAWFARSRHKTAEDPYYLYAASNAGSLTALLSYPLFFEPNLRLADQSWMWLAVYGGFIALVGACGAMVWRTDDGVEEFKTDANSPRTLANDVTISPRRHPDLGTRLRWIALSLVPSSLLLGVTTYITTDIAPVPLLWIIPLALYLLSFILVFSRLGPLLHLVMVPLLPVAIGVLLSVKLLGMPQLDLIEAIILHLVGFFVATMVCHGELARTRPTTAYLTEYYLWMALGGVLGGMLNAFVAPMVFDRIIEYPLAIALVCLLRPHWNIHELLAGAAKKGTGDEVKDAPVERRTTAERSSRRRRGAKPQAASGPIFPTLGRLSVLGSGVWYVAGVAALMLFFMTSHESDPQVEKVSKRNFFGVVQVKQPLGRPFIEFYHGTTLHGLQNPKPEERNVARSYFHEKGPIGQVLKEFFDGPEHKKKIGVVGLGIGSLAVYAKYRDQTITFYEIDPNVERVAKDTQYFTFLDDCAKRGVRVKVVLGDGRLQLQETSERYDVLVLDAFSSDSVPVHLLTRQALEIYLDHLSDNGILAFNISTKYLRLEPVLADLAGEAGLLGFVKFDPASEYEHMAVQAAIEEAQQKHRLSPAVIDKIAEAHEKDLMTGRAPSKWVIMARRPEHLGTFAADRRWQALQPRADVSVWSDDYSNLLSVFVWSERAEEEEIAKLMRQQMSQEFKQSSESRPVK